MSAAIKELLAALGIDHKALSVTQEYVTQGGEPAIVTGDVEMAYMFQTGVVSTVKVNLDAVPGDANKLRLREESVAKQLGITPAEMATKPWEVLGIKPGVAHFDSSTCEIQRFATFEEAKVAHMALAAVYFPGTVVADVASEVETFPEAANTSRN